jgi:hypothetical protein
VALSSDHNTYDTGCIDGVVGVAILVCNRRCGLITPEKRLEQVSRIVARARKPNLKVCHIDKPLVLVK